MKGKFKDVATLTDTLLRQMSPEVKCLHSKSSFTDPINFEFLSLFSNQVHYVKQYFYSRLDAICPFEV